VLFNLFGGGMVYATTYTTEQYILDGKLHRVIVTSSGNNKITSSYIKDDNLGICAVKYSSENEVSGDKNYLIIDCEKFKSIFTER
jgi:hypothetical protein